MRPAEAGPSVDPRVLCPHCGVTLESEPARIAQPSPRIEQQVLHVSTTNSVQRQVEMAAFGAAGRLILIQCVHARRIT